MGIDRHSQGIKLEVISQKLDQVQSVQRKRDAVVHIVSLEEPLVAFVTKTCMNYL